MIVGDMTDMPFADGLFDEIWCDPPHLVRNDIAKWGNPKYFKFGYWPTRKIMEQSLEGMAAEFHRVTKPNAILIMKIISGSSDKQRRCIGLADMFPFDVYWKTISIDREMSRFTWSTAMTLHILYAKRSPNPSPVILL